MSMKITEVGGVKMPDSKPPVISITIGTKHEEKCFEYCLDAVFCQKVGAESEVVWLDNESKDYAVQVAKRYPVGEFVEIKNFIPGQGIKG